MPGRVQVLCQVLSARGGSGTVVLPASFGTACLQPSPAHCPCPGQQWQGALAQAPPSPQCPALCVVTVLKGDRLLGSEVLVSWDPRVDLAMEVPGYPSTKSGVLGGGRHTERVREGLTLVALP